MEYKSLSQFCMVFSNLLSMNILAKSSLASKGSSLCFNNSTSACFGPVVEFVMSGLIWKVSPSSFAGFKFCHFRPKDQNCTVNLYLKL